EAVQRLRARARAEGNLNSTKEQTVTVEPAPVSGQSGAQQQVIVIEPTNPEVVYVPSYNPTVVYGAWPDPAYPPYRPYPPGYAFGVAAISYGLGLAGGGALGQLQLGRREHERARRAPPELFEERQPVQRRQRTYRARPANAGRQ